MKRVLLATLVLVLTVAGFGSELGSVAKQFDSKYKDQRALLRKPNCDRDLEFDARRMGRGPGNPGNEISCSALVIRHIREHKGKILVEIQRGVLVYDDSLKKLDLLLDEDGGLIKIDVPPNETAQEFQTTLDAIFEFGLDAHLNISWIPSVPQAWEHQDELRGTQIGSFNGQPVYFVKRGVVEAPKAIKTPDPEYSELARSRKLQGTTVLWTIIGTDGRAKLIGVIKPLGMGLTAKAVEVLSRWTFQPATKDGAPVQVMIRIETNFRLY